MQYNSFDNELKAMSFRDSKRNEGYASSLFVYSKDRCMVITDECTTKEEQAKSQMWLSRKASKTTKDIENWMKIKGLIASPDFGDNLEDTVFIAKMLEEEQWFPTIKSVISFFDYPSDSVEKIKELVKESLEFYDDEWEDYLKLANKKEAKT